MFIFLHFVVLGMRNICLLFTLLFVCLHVGYDVTNDSLYLCLFLYIYAPFYVLNC